MHLGDAKATLEIILIDLLECLENLCHRVVCKMVDCHEAYLLTQHQEEWDLVHKKDISHKEHFLVKVQQLRRDLDSVPCHYIGFAACGLAFQCRNVLPPNLGSNIYILDRHRAVLDLVAPEYPLEILDRWVSECTVESPGGFSCL